MKLSEAYGLGGGGQGHMRLSETMGSAGEPKQDGGPGLGSLFHSFLRESGAALGDMARQLPGEVGRFAGDVGQAMLPGRGGAEAGGRVVGKLGDVGTFASGGLTNPLAVPAGGLARGLDVRPRVAQPPRPQLALPPPTVTTAGRPGVSTGLGMIPPGPSATMTAPSATPVGGAAAAAPKPAAAPLVGAEVSAGRPSQFASAIASNDGTAIDRGLVKRYRGLVRPSAPGQLNQKGLMMQDQRITTAVDSLIDAKDSIRLKDAAGNELPAGRLPRTLDEFVQGIDHLKTQIFDQYDTLAQQQGGQGARVPLQPAAQRLMQIASEPQVVDLHPALAKEAGELAQQWMARGSYSPKEMQNVVQHLNEQLSGLMRNPTHETFSRSTMLGQVIHTLRDTLNQTMETALQGPQYQSLRSRYAALSSIEGDVANALRREAAKTPGLAHTLGDLGFWMNALHGVVTLDPTAIGRAAALKGGQQIIKHLRSPNRAVTKLFANRASDLSPGASDRASAAVATRIGEMRQKAYDANVLGNLPEVRRLDNQRRNLFGQQ